MPTYTIEGTVAGYCWAVDPEAAVADGVETTGNFWVGWANGPQWQESLAEFDTSTVVGAVTSVTLSIFGINDASDTDFTVEARIHDWGGTVDVADWVPGADLGSPTLVATLATAGFATFGFNTFMSAPSFLANINQAGMTRVLLSSSDQRLGVTPPGDAGVAFIKDDAVGEGYRPTLVIVTSDLPPPPRSLMARNVGRGRLGCGVNRAYVTWKCGSPRFCPVLETTEITYNRALSDISEAEVIVPLSGNADDVCCECLGDIEPWCHELHIERDGVDVWLGPITEVVYEFDKVTIRAMDLLGWLTVRIAEIEISNFEIDPAAPDLDMTVIAQEILAVAFADDDPCALDYVSALPSGVMGQRLFPPYTDTAFDQLDALAQTGAPEYTVVGRTIILMGPQTPTTPIATLMDEHILGVVQLTKDGKLQANRWFVHYDEDDTDFPPGPGVANAPDRYCYGLIERMKDGTGLPNKTNAEESGQILLDATPHATMPRLLEIPDGSQLSPLAPWPLSAMIPGVRCDVGITRLCVDATASFRLVGVGVRQDASGEQVTLSLGALNPLVGEI